MNIAKDNNESLFWLPYFSADDLMNQPENTHLHVFEVFKSSFFSEDWLEGSMNETGRKLQNQEKLNELEKQYVDFI